MNGFCRCGSVGSMQVLTRCKCVNDVADVQTALRPLCACDDEIWDGWWWFLWEKRKKKVPCVLFVVYSSWKGETSKTRNNLVIKTVAFHRRAIKSVYSGLRTLRVHRCILHKHPEQCSCSRNRLQAENRAGTMILSGPSFCFGGYSDREPQTWPSDPITITGFKGITWNMSNLLAGNTYLFDELV